MEINFIRTSGEATSVRRLLFNGVFIVAVGYATSYAKTLGEKDAQRERFSAWDQTLKDVTDRRTRRREARERRQRGNTIGDE